ncbi:DUF5106 domain-containing protein [Bacteroides cellulosilyticus]|uniref:DUF5106 domain-containing protein n=1 Tax=Bacteroides cellulosilyticus TaxID=246787 RepID=UPI003562BC10
MRRIKNKIEDRVRYWLDECDTYTVSLFISGFFTLMVIGGVSLILLVACMRVCKSNEASQEDKTEKSTLHTARYTRPEIPQMMTDPQQRAAYYVKHYWDGYSLADTAFIRSNDTEQLFSDFIGSLQYVAPEESSAALKRMMCRMEEDSTAYARFCMLSEKYLYDPNSPMRSEEYFIPILEQMVGSRRLDEYEKIRPADRLAQAHKNRPGMAATDFSYVTLKGKAGRMSGINADYTLLFFYEPDCSNCRKYEQILAELPAFIEMQEKGIVRVLAVYPDDNEEEWLLKSSHMPRGWIVGWNKQGDIRSKTLYEIRATPTMYLLDKQKKVILKDASLEQTIGYLAAVYPGPTE